MEKRQNRPPNGVRKDDQIRPKRKTARRTRGARAYSRLTEVDFKLTAAPPKVGMGGAEEKEEEVGGV